MIDKSSSSAGCWATAWHVSAAIIPASVETQFRATTKRFIGTPAAGCDRRPMTHAFHQMLTGPRLNRCLDRARRSLA